MQNAQKRAIIQSTNGKFFTAVFRKKDGTLREMNCRLGVVKHLKGGENTKAHLDQYINVFDAQKGAYRTINLDTLISIKTGDAVIILNK
jgi:hypothetical protein